MLTTFHPSSTQRSTMVWNASNLWQMTIFHAGSCPCCDDSSALSCVLVKLINYLRGLRMDASQWFHRYGASEWSYLNLVAAGSCQYPLNDFGLSVRIVLGVLPGLGCQFALCLFVDQSVTGMIAQPIAKQQHLLDLFTPLRKDMQISRYIGWF